MGHRVLAETKRNLQGSASCASKRRADGTVTKLTPQEQQDMMGPKYKHPAVGWWASCRGCVKKIGTAAMTMQHVKGHIIGTRFPAHGLFRELPRTIGEATKKWHLESGGGGGGLE